MQTRSQTRFNQMVDKIIKWWKTRLLYQSKNKTCFYTQESFACGGPYFFHVQQVEDEKTKKVTVSVFRFDPRTLDAYIRTSKNPINPFTKVMLNGVELRRLNKLAYRRDSKIPRDGLQSSSSSPSSPSSPFLMQQNLLESAFDLFQQLMQDPIQELFERTPQEMIAFLRTDLSNQTPDNNRSQFVSGVVELMVQYIWRFNPHISPNVVRTRFLQNIPSILPWIESELANHDRVAWRTFVRRLTIIVAQRFNHVNRLAPAFSLQNLLHQGLILTV